VLQLKKWKPAVAAALGLVLMLGAAPGAAQADDGYWRIQAGNDWRENAGILTVFLDHPADVVHAQLTDIDTGAVVADAGEFTLTFHRADEWRYQNADPVVAPPASRYQIAVQVVDADGVTHTENMAGEAPFQVIVSPAEVTTTPATVDYDHRTVTLRGVLRGTWPGSGEVRPVGGRPVRIDAAYEGSEEPVTTAADGTFERTFDLAAGLRTDVDISYQRTQEWELYRQDDQRLLTVGIDPQDTRVVVAVDRTTATEGETLHVTGTAQRHGAGGWVGTTPWTTNVYVTYRRPDDSVIAEPGWLPVAADGAFDLEVTARETGYFRFDFTEDVNHWLSASQSDTETVTVTPAA
jgi:hypothetical protein